MLKYYRHLLRDHNLELPPYLAPYHGYDIVTVEDSADEDGVPTYEAQDPSEVGDYYYVFDEEYFVQIEDHEELDVYESYESDKVRWIFMGTAAVI